MLRVADDVVQIPLLPRNGINAWLLGDVLVDTGVKSSGDKLVKALGGRKLDAIAITHGHADHVGSASQLVDERSVPVWVGTRDRPGLEEGTQEAGSGPLGWLASRGGGFDAVHVDRSLAEGDELGATGFTVLDTPGHSPGHVAFWRERDRVLVCGDVFTNMNLLTTRVGLHLPPDGLTPDPAENRRSAERLAALEPDVVCFGHGPVLTGAAPKLKAFLAKG